MHLLSSQKIRDKRQWHIGHCLLNHSELGERKVMKVCQYCGSVNEDTAIVCSACGAREFRHKCNNCGTEYEEEVERCPNCGSPRREYQAASAATIPPIKRERKTWLWVLGWLLCFPIPIFVLAWRTERIIVRIIAVLAIPFLFYAYMFYFFFMVGCILTIFGY